MVAVLKYVGNLPRDHNAYVRKDIGKYQRIFVKLKLNKRVIQGCVVPDSFNIFGRFPQILTEFSLNNYNYPNS